MRYNPTMRYVRQAGSDPAFLLKALGEAAGELHRAYAPVSYREWHRMGEGDDEGWCLLAIPWHVREVERGVFGQIETILSRREPDIRHVDFDDIPFKEDYWEEDAEELLEEFHYLRRHTVYSLYDLSDRDWERTGIHPYRGPLSVLQIVREVYQHDLEHLWQTRRMIDQFAGAVR